MIKNFEKTDTSPVRYLDSTLRDGQQGPGFYFTHIQKCSIIRGLSNANVTNIEIPSHDVGEMRRLVKFCRKLSRKITIIAWCRLDWDEIRQAIACGCDQINVSVPSSRIMQEAKTGLNLVELARKIRETGHLLGRSRTPWALGLEDASRASENDLSVLAATAMEAGAMRIRYADTLGLLDPWELESRLNILVQNFPVVWEFHGHDDRGLVLANSMAAIRAGVRMLSGTLGGVGERAGNLKTEEAALIMDTDRRKDGVPDTGRLAGLSARVLGWSGRPCSPWRPYFGHALHRHESGIHVAALLKDNMTYDPWLRKGDSLEFWPGPNSGRKAIVEAARLLGWQVDREQAAKIKNLMTHRFARNGGLDVWEVFSRSVEWVTGNGRVG